MAGKEHLERDLRLLVGGYDLSGDSRTFSEAQNMWDQVMNGGWSELVRSYLAGYRTTGLAGYQAILNDATGRAFNRLKDAPNSTQLSLLFGGAGEPAYGDPAYMLASLQLSDNAAFNAGLGVLNASFIPDGAQSADQECWGKVLYPSTAISATTTGTSQNNGASSANGGHAILHLLVSSGGTWAITIEHSPDNAAWATLITFSSDGSAVGSEHKAVTGTVDQYLRAVFTRTSGTLTPAVTFARG